MVFTVEVFTVEDTCVMPELQESQEVQVSVLVITKEKKLKGLKWIRHLDRMEYTPGF